MTIITTIITTNLTEVAVRRAAPRASKVRAAARQTFGIFQELAKKIWDTLVFFKNWAKMFGTLWYFSRIGQKNLGHFGIFHELGKNAWDTLVFFRN